MAWALLGVFWIGALLSFAKRRQRAHLLETRTGLDSLAAMDWRHFEMLTGEAFRRRGYAVREQGLGGADGGIDLVLTRSGAVTLVQCKQWRRQRVDVRVVREMFGLLAHHRAQAVIIVCIGDFTPDARRFAQGKPIELIHGEGLLRMIHDVQSTPPAPATPAPSPKKHPDELPASGEPARPELSGCPRCGGPMVQRANRRTGQSFWGCATYPACRGTRTLN